MPNYCNLQLSGHLGKDPDLRYTPNGKAVVSFTVAYNPGKKDDNKPTVWSNCKAWGDNAEAIAQKFQRGAGIVITSASPEVRKWTDKDGKPRETLEWIVWKFEEYEKKENGGGGAGGGYEEPSFNPDDDIPFLLPPHLMA